MVDREQPAQEPAGHGLRQRYGASGDALLSKQPVVVIASMAPLEHYLRVLGSGADVDPVLRRLGDAHLQRLRARVPSMFDGPVLNLVDCAPDGLSVAVGTYFDMIGSCGAVAAEYDNEWTDLPLRDRADEVAGDPLRSGRGRAAAVGLSVVVTVPAGAGRAALVGRRRADLAVDPSRLHVIPSGMLEPSDGSPLLESAQRELAEELGVRLSLDELRDRLSVLGTAHDLLRLRPEVCLRLDLTDRESARLDPHHPPAEFEEFVDVSLEQIPPLLTSGEPLTPAGAGALALLVGQG